MIFDLNDTNDPISCRTSTDRLLGKLYRSTLSKCIPNTCNRIGLLQLEEKFERLVLSITTDSPLMRANRLHSSVLAGCFLVVRLFFDVC